MGPSEQGEHTVSFLNGRFEFLVQILFREKQKKRT